MPCWGPSCSDSLQTDSKKLKLVFLEVQVGHILEIARMSQAARQAWELSLTQLGFGDNLAQDTDDACD